MHMEMQDDRVGVHGQPDKAKEIYENLKEARMHFADWRAEARECYDFFAGRQWSTEDEATLRKDNRPCVTFNRIARTINAVAGLELQNRQELRFNGREVSDSGFGEMFTSAAKWVRDGCDAEDEESESFQDTLICGEGWTETRLDTESENEPQIKIDRIDSLEMLVDPDAKKRNHDDSRWRARIKSLTRREFETLFPDADFIPGLFWNDAEGKIQDDINEWKYEENLRTDKLNQNKMVSVAQYQDWERYPVYRVQIYDKLEDFTEEEFLAKKSEFDMFNLKYVKIFKRRYKQYFFAGKFILEEQDLDCNHFTFNSITGLRDRNTNTWFGIVSLMKDPQRWSNKFFSQIMHITNTSAKSGAIVEESAVVNQRDLEESYAKPGSINVLRDGALSQGRFMPKSPPPYPDGVDRMMQYAVQAINDTPGVSLELIGMTAREQAMGLEDMRKQSGITVLANFFDSLRRYRKEQGRVLAYFIKEYISDGRLIRVLGDEGAKYVPLIKDDLAFDYDIIVDDAPTSPNMKERTFRIMSQILPLVLQAGIPIPPEILEYAPLPDGLVQKWKAMINKGQEDPTEQQMKMIQMMLAQLEVQQKQADIEKTASEQQLNYAKAEQAHATGQDESAQAMQKIGANQAELQMKEKAMQEEQARKNIEMLLNMQRKMLESQMQMKLKEQQASQPRSTTQNE